MLTRKQALLTVALDDRLYHWQPGGNRSVSTAAPTTPMVQPCPFAGPDADGDGLQA